MMSAGKLTVICGPMFSGKTEALIAHAMRLPGRKVYKPVTDTRNKGTSILSHGGRGIFAESVDVQLAQLINRGAPALDTKHILIDEAQFLAHEAVDHIALLTRHGVSVVLAGLDLDAHGKPFGHMGEVLALADAIQKLSGTCSKCGRPSSRTRCKVLQETQVLVGGGETYEPLCRTCHDCAK